MAGRVRVNGEVAGVGARVDPDADVVEVDGALVMTRADLVHYLLHKPAGVVTTASDTPGRPTVVDLVPDEPRVVPVGRLDVDTEGLLLLTNDGDLANALMHPRYGIEKEYLAEVDAVPTPKHVGHLRRGVELEDGLARAKSARVAGRSGERGAVRLVMTEGRKREVRRLLAAVGLPVTRLVRVRVGEVRLGRLSPGERRELTHDEVVALRRVVDR